MRDMSTDLTFGTGRFQQEIRFVVVNNRVPCANQHCAMCNDLIEKGYVRDLQTRLVYCDTPCFAGWTHGSIRVLKDRERKAS